MQKTCAWPIYGRLYSNRAPISLAIETRVRCLATTLQGVRAKYYVADDIKLAYDPSGEKSRPYDPGLVLLHLSSWAAQMLRGWHEVASPMIHPGG